ncbi:leucyl aminopeptidase [Devosia enhydra]|uniref:Probable cytosol aminopeptidase n=1 Tax=Devosia enhydra TaxID=665118 RepID=A0A1K2HT65_9HYPH|nr:leucyl aminopeptidase [Devosia enhydra]SFZ80899.1 leucyl aminopeptidase [Devosia enhydra]
MAQTLSLALAPVAIPAEGALVLYVGEERAPEGRAAAIWAETGLDWAKVVAASGFKGRQGQVIDIVAPHGLAADRLLILGSGKPVQGQPDPTAWSDRGGSLMGKLMAARIARAAVLLEGPEAGAPAIGEIAAGLRLRHYRFDRYRAAKPDAGPDAMTVTLMVPEGADLAALQAAIDDRMAVAEGTILARDLVNEPANVLGPVEFAEKAAALGDLGLQIEVLDDARMQALGMNALLAVAQGSRRPARMVIMQWKGGDPGDAPLAFVGKGVTFDSGGLSIKPAANMENMKGDMGGAAAVTGLMQALATRKARVNAVGVIGLVENMADGNAFRPGDIIRAMSGTTIEVISTDAEGRMVLADALWHTQQAFRPRLVIDLATLTGAVLVALGQEYAGLFSNDNTLSAQLAAAGLASGEKVWRLPMGASYDKMIESRFADIKNTGGRNAASITAAQFLARFVKDVPWAHLDIAGMAFAGSNSETNTSWGPGFGVALLDRFIRDNYEG